MSAKADGKLLTEIKHTKQGLRCMVSFWIATLKADKNFDVSQQAAKIRLVDLDYTKAEGAYLFVDGHYICGCSFEFDSLEKIRHLQFLMHIC